MEGVAKHKFDLSSFDADAFQNDHRRLLEGLLTFIFLHTVSLGWRHEMKSETWMGCVG
jgi:hypothetical protein